MNILIDGQVLETDEIRRGIGVYFINVLENMIKQNAGDVWYITSSKYIGSGIFDEWTKKQLVLIKNDLFRPSTDYAAEDEYTDALNGLIREYQIDVVWFPDPMMVNVLFPSKKLDCKMFITMFDLIPYVMPIKEWPDFVKKEYQRRLDYLEKYDVYALSISKATDMDYRKIVREDVNSRVTFLAANEKFLGAVPAKKEKDYVLFTGGFDYRKNIKKAVEAYSLALKKYKDSDIADSYFYIVCKCSEDQKNEMLSLFDPDTAQRIKFTGYISDEELASMYAGARVFFFPSLYEGFGLPILEAMYAGAYVLSADNSSLPEVCGDLADFCNAEDVEDMALKLAESFDKAGRETEADRLKRIEYAKSFTWAKTAKATYEYFEEVCFEDSDEERYKIAIVTPWPAQKTGIASYSSNIFPYLKQYFDVDIYVDDPNKEVVNNGEFEIYDIETLPEKADEYDEILYQIGNNTEFHKNAFKMLTEHKGMAEIHDFDLSQFFYRSFFLGGDKKLMRNALKLGYGHEALNYIDRIEDQLQFYDGKYKMSDSVAAYSDSVIFHNKWSALECKSHCKRYVVPLACFDADEVDETSIQKMKEKINYSDSDFIIGMFGFINKNKRYEILVKAFKKLNNKNAKLVFFGKDPNGELASLLKKEKIENKAVIMGYMDDDEYMAGLKMTDIVVNLRYPTMGESSATLCEALTMGKPTIVTGINQYLEFPDDVCWKLPCNPEKEEKEVFTLYRMLEELTASKDLRDAMGENAREYAKNVLSSKRIAEKYYHVIKQTIKAKKK